MTSYQFSERINFQVVLWAVAGAVYWSVVGVAQAVRWALAMVVTGLAALAPHAGIVAKAVALTVLVVAVAAAVASIPPTFWLGLAIVAAFGWVTYPRTVRR